MIIRRSVIINFNKILQLKMSKALTIELIHMKTKTNRIDSIKSLNLWGNDLDDISIVTQMSHIEVLSLAVNYISTLKDI